MYSLVLITYLNNYLLSSKAIKRMGNIKLKKLTVLRECKEFKKEIPLIYWSKVISIYL